MAPNPVRTFYKTRGIPEESSKQPPRKPKFAKKEESTPQEEHCTNGLRCIKIRLSSLVNINKVP